MGDQTDAQWIPVLAHWDVTYGCNLRCSFCLTASGRPASGELSTDEAIALIDDMHDAGVAFLRVLGGEPFVRKDIISLFQHAVSRGMLLSFSTNGTLLTRAHATALGAMRESLTYVQLSLYGADEVSYGSVTGRQQCFESALRGLRLLVGNGLEVSVLVVATPENVRRLGAYYDLAREAGAAEVRVAPVVPLGRHRNAAPEPPSAKAALWSALLEEMARIGAAQSPEDPLLRVQARPLLGERLRKIEHVESYYQDCLAGTVMFFVDATGQAAPCPFGAQMTDRVRRAHPYLHLQKLGDRTVGEVWRSDVFQRFRDHHEPSTNPAILAGCKYFREGACLPCVLTPCTCIEEIHLLDRPLAGTGKAGD